MFDEFIARMIAEMAVKWSSDINARLEANYLESARQWATSKTYGSTAAPPAVPMAIQFQVRDGGVVPVTTATPVSAIQPESFLPTYGTDVNAVGGPVGGPIPGQQDKFYATSNANPQPGEIARVNGSTYVYQRPTPFGGFWLKV
jgi:hypothetical protein